jgi:hypothetical protein
MYNTNWVDYLTSSRQTRFVPSQQPWLPSAMWQTATWLRATISILLLALFPGR